MPPPFGTLTPELLAARAAARLCDLPNGPKENGHDGEKNGSPNCYCPANSPSKSGAQAPAILIPK